MSYLFTPLVLRQIEFKNRIFLSPMCQYAGEEGMPNEWHMVHLGSRAVGGTALILTEATAVSPEGRISLQDLGIWSDDHIPAFKRLTEFINAQGSLAGIQLAHAGRKASTGLPWQGGKTLGPEAGGWQPLAPSPIPFGEGSAQPHEMTVKEIEETVAAFQNAARRAFDAGFKVVEIHMAHGYLLHEFLSPISNQRSDSFGGSFENRIRFPLMVADAVRQSWPSDLPLFVRISCTDWVEGGWDLKQSVELATRLKSLGVDLIDCSSGGLVPSAKIPIGPGYQVPFAAEIRSCTGIAVGTVGLITEPLQAEQILAEGKADAVIMGRELLRNPYWPLQAAKTLNVDLQWPVRYLRAKPA